MSLPLCDARSKKIEKTANPPRINYFRIQSRV